MRTTSKKSGFTLVELMIVAAIVAILAAIIIPLLSRNKVTAVAAEGQNWCGAFMTAAKTQYARTSVWPNYATLDDDDLKSDFTGDTDWTTAVISSNTVTVTGGQGDITGTITLSSGEWAGTGSFAYLTATP